MTVTSGGTRAATPVPRPLPAGVALRAARPGDEPALWSVHTRAIRISAATHYTEDELDAWAGRARPEHYTELMRARPMIVAEIATSDRARVAGFGQLQPEEGVIEAIYVDPDFARRGIGRAIFEALEHLARERGLPGLTVEASLNSASFYEAMGCMRRGLDRHELAPGVHIACVVMDKRFAPAGVAA